MRNPTDPTNAAIARYLAGDSAPAEAAEINRWIASDPAHRARVEALRSIWTAPAPNVAWDMDAMWSTIQGRVADDGSVGPSLTQSPVPASAAIPQHRRFEIPGGRRRHWARIPLAIAAALVALVGSAKLYLDARSHGHSIATAAQPSAPPHEYVTARGQRASIQLSDGSHVTLAPESRLVVDAEFGGATREVALEGEAIFDVVHDAGHPFRVRSGGAVVQDVGTRFDLRAYPADSSAVVAVEQGRVTFGPAPALAPGTAMQTRDPSEGLVLSRGEVGRIDRTGSVTSAAHVELARYFGWSSGHLAFVSEPLPNVLRTISRWYDLDVRIGDGSLARRFVTAEFSTDDASEIIDDLAAAVDARVERTGRVVRLTPR